MTKVDEMNQIINNCHYRKDIGDGMIICRLHILPCIRVVDTGMCDELNEKMKEKKDEHKG